ncbi:hypothetical protein Taro_051943 [Colocasia esculenta]|uniref:Uncharacterized protein n=1 Tax=Colocasia esculenta TaxID=4460 RepID=A0A843XI68_COLES|nr:hypothetical protein [Colocasia esculenta]
MLGACIVRLWSHAVAPVFRELPCLDGCVPRFCFRFVGVPAALASKGLLLPHVFVSAGSAGVVFGLTRVVVEAFLSSRCFVVL